jgi:hypothetical protein
LASSECPIEFLSHLGNAWLRLKLRAVFTSLV